MTDRQVSVDSPGETTEALQARVATLEATTAEYRRQLEGILASSSWRLTAPLRTFAAYGRAIRHAISDLSERVTNRRAASSRSVAGLFPPVVTERRGPVTMDSPLLAHPEPTLHPRQPCFRGGALSDARVLVVAHVYYPEVWSDIEQRLPLLPEPYDLIVSLVEGATVALEAEIARRLPRAVLHRVPNVARDVGSLIELAAEGVFDAYDAVLKIHTKRSPHRVDGDMWRIALLDGLMPSDAGIRRVIELFRRDPSVGLVVPAGHIGGPETWGANQPLVEALAARIPFAFDPSALRYPAGSMYWARPWILKRLADLELGPEHFEPEAGHVDGSTAHALERFVGLAAQASGLEMVETAAVPARLNRVPRRRRPRVLAFYLPQFHRIPENDMWWGEGFTEWTNVDQARPLYDGHRQPRRVGELGQYDLSDPGVMRRQAALAHDHGVDGFVMHHYWFDRRKLLDAPLNNLLADPTIHFPFALCWANENWTRRWDGLDSEVLIAQTYSDGWADRFYHDIHPALRDPRYVTVDGLPLLVIYRVGHVPGARSAILKWKEYARRDGLGGLHVLAVDHPRQFERLPAGVDAVVDGLIRFPPLGGIGLRTIKHLAPGASVRLKGDIYSYDAAVDSADLRTSTARGLPVHPGVMPGWDNTPRRRESAHVFHGSSPVSFRRWVARAAAAAADGSGLLFVNAWNEWAEGAYLEPDAHFGNGYLEAIRDVLGASESSAPPTGVSAPPALIESTLR